jgi:crotonobetainyl-CoA:carnitine CoA-transferase CaiB-like acyl-CoA transferase
VSLLEGVRVLDLSRLLPGPYATSLLAGLGAEVIKVEEPPAGDPMRAIPPFGGDAGDESLHFLAVNRGKKSLAVNLKHPDGLAAFQRLATGADAVLEGFRPGVAARLGVGYEALRALNPRLVYCSLSGYGQDGPLSGRAGHDINYLALSGALGLSGEADGQPTVPAFQAADLGGGLLTALAMVAGILSARQGGAGCYLDASMFHLMASWVGVHAGSCLVGWGEATRGGLPLTGASPCYRVYRTRDGGYMSLGALETRFWLAFCRAAGRPDLEDRQHDPEALGDMETLFASRTRAEWQTLLAGADACCEPVLDLEEALAGAAGRGPLVVDGQRPEMGAAPRVGQHTAELLRQAGLSDVEIAAMVETGAVSA